MYDFIGQIGIRHVREVKNLASLCHAFWIQIFTSYKNIEKKIGGCIVRDCTCINLVAKFYFQFQKDHFKSDWHRYNLQRKLKGKTTLTEEEFDDACGELTKYM